jgi:hypothetical protein
MKRVHKTVPDGFVGGTAAHSGDPWFIVSWNTGYPDKNFFWFTQGLLRVGPRAFGSLAVTSKNPSLVLNFRFKSF